MCEPLLILCGGLSRRMGFPKPLLQWQGQTLIERLVCNSLPQQPVWLSAAGKQYARCDGVEYLDDALPGHQGPLASILPALRQAKTLGYGGVYVMACDTLLLPSMLMERLDTAFRQPEWQCGLVMLAGAKNSDRPLHPLLGHWSVMLADSLQGYLNQNQRKVMQWVAGVACHPVAMPPAWQYFSNFNTRTDFVRAQTEWEQQCHSAI